jgi:hypothetical protein
VLVWRQGVTDGEQVAQSHVVPRALQRLVGREIRIADNWRSWLLVPVLRRAASRASSVAVMSRDIVDKILVIWKAFQRIKWYAVYVEDIAIKVDLIDPLDPDIVLWSILYGDEIEPLIKSFASQFFRDSWMRWVVKLVQYLLKLLSFVHDGVRLPHGLKHGCSKTPRIRIRIGVVDEIYLPIAVYVVPASAHACR